VKQGMLLTVLFSSVMSTVITAAVMLAILPAVVEAQVNTLRAGQIVAVGENGTDRIRLVPGSGDEASVLVADGSGQDRIRLLIQNHPSGVADTGIAIRSASGMTMMRLGNVAQDPELPAPLLHSANLLLRDENGHDHIRLLVADDGTPSIQLLNAAGELVWSAP
jgi:hypothetical protein